MATQETNSNSIHRFVYTRQMNYALKAFAKLRKNNISTYNIYSGPNQSSRETISSSTLPDGRGTDRFSPPLKPYCFAGKIHVKMR